MTLLHRLVTVHLATTLFALLVLAMVYVVRDKLHRRKEKKYIYRCKNCGYIYLFSRNMPMQSCPKCGQLNDVLRN